jgi:hypothetical protein
MTEWTLYDYVDVHGANQFKAWSECLQKRELAKLNAKLDMLQQHGPSLPPRLLAGPIRGHGHIYKLEIRGQVQLRPLLCKGPIRNDEEYSLLIGAIEQGWKLLPTGAAAEAERRRQEITTSPQARRTLHERVL